MLALHMIQALNGDCFLLEIGSPAQPHFVLVDGGPATVYAEHLRPVLAKVAARGGKLDMVVLTHADDDHVIGLVDFFKEMALSGGCPLLEVGAMWMNSFAFDALVAPSMANIRLGPLPAAQVQGGEEPPAPAFGVAEGMDLRHLVQALHIPVNAGFANDLVTLDAAPKPLLLGDVTLQVVGPTHSNVDLLRREWTAWLEKHRPTTTAPAAPDLRKPVAPDQSIPNRGSIMFVAECGGKRILLTGDGRGSDIVRGLTRAKLLPKDGVFHVDVLKMPHHGSARNVSRKFFAQVTADTYVISADGKNDNPDLVTLLWLLEAVQEQRRHVRLVVSNTTPALEELVQMHPPEQSGYQLEVLPPGQSEAVIVVA